VSIHFSPQSTTLSETVQESELAHRWLQDYCRRERSVRSALLLLGTGQGPQPMLHWPHETPANSALVAAARAALKRNRALAITPPVSSSGSEPGRILSLPLVSGDKALGALAVSVLPGPPDSDETLLDDLAGHAAALAHRLDSPNSGHGPAAAVLQCQAFLLKPQPLAQAVGALASDLASRLGFDRVSVGLKRGADLDVIALSHGAQVGQQQDLVRAMSAAMLEAIDQSVSIAFPLPNHLPPRIVHAHSLLAGQGPGSVLTVPLVHAGQSIGALCCERTAPLAPDAVRGIEHLACVLAPIIDLKQRAEQPWHRHARRALHTYWADRTYRTRRLVWLAAGVAALALACWPTTYNVGAPARLEGAVQRVLVAPSDGYLQAVHVRPGEPVRAGQVLVELAQQDLLLQSQRWEAELRQHENTGAAALARADRAQYALAQARAAEAAAQLELARSQLARSRLTAPIDGMVIKGDLSQGLGAPVQRGDALLTLAPQNAFRVVVEVDEREVGAVALGQRGQLALAALPGDRLDFEVSRINPIATSHDGQNAFEVEARLDQPATGLRPGLQGVAKIQTETRTLGWIATHRVWDWIALKLWSWVG
jgi:RND family efflux transporter MFP subunit